MTLSKETLMAYVDGELPSEELARVEAELAVNAEARTYVERQQALSRRLHTSFDDILDLPIPKAFPESSAPRRRFFHALSWPHLALWTGLPAAGALACGLLIGLMLSGSDVVSTNDGLVARGALDDALTHKVAADESGKIGISFRDKDGHYCRTFRERTMAGVACRQGGDWTIAAIGNVAPESGSDYRQAGSVMPDFIRSTVNAMIAGEPLNADGERKARDAGWNPRKP